MSFTCWYRPGVRRSANRKLTEEQKLQVYRLYHAIPGAVEVEQLARDFSVSQSSVYSIVKNHARYANTRSER